MNTIKVWHNDGSVLLVTQRNGDQQQYQSSGDARLFDLEKGDVISMVALPWPTPAGNHPADFIPTLEPCVWITGGPARIVSPTAVAEPLGKAECVRLVLGQPFKIKA